eukprot:364166-Chlamydomonas_euryale.AAC.6
MLGRITIPRPWSLTARAVTAAVNVSARMQPTCEAHARPGPFCVPSAKSSRSANGYHDTCHPAELRRSERRYRRGKARCIAKETKRDACAFAPSSEGGWRWWWRGVGGVVASMHAPVFRAPGGSSRRHASNGRLPTPRRKDLACTPSSRIQLRWRGAGGARTFPARPDTFLSAPPANVSGFQPQPQRLRNRAEACRASVRVSGSNAC